MEQRSKPAPSRTAKGSGLPHNLNVTLWLLTGSPETLGSAHLRAATNPGVPGQSVFFFPGVSQLPLGLESKHLKAPCICLSRTCSISRLLQPYVRARSSVTLQGRTRAVPGFTPRHRHPSGPKRKEHLSETRPQSWPPTSSSSFLVATSRCSSKTQLNFPTA